MNRSHSTRALRGKVLDLYRRRYDGTLSLSAADFATVIHAGFVTSPEEYLSKLTELLATEEQAEPGSPVNTRIVVSGSLIEHPRILEVVEEAGGRVVADDLCTGLRTFVPREGEGGTPMERLVDRYVNRYPCPRQGEGP